MILNIKAALQEETIVDDFRFSDVSVDLDSIQAIMINEVVPLDPEQDFYGKWEMTEYMKTTIPLFQKAGITVNSIADIVSRGIYITNAVKIPKTDYTIEKSSIERSLDILEREISLFPNIKVVVLMGDVAKKAYNMITKKKTGNNVIPSGSTYKIRKEEFYNGKIRVIPSYIMTGGNILIEKSKFEMVSEDIKTMINIIKG